MFRDLFSILTYMVDPVSLTNATSNLVLSVCTVPFSRLFQLSPLTWTGSLHLAKCPQAVCVMRGMGYVSSILLLQSFLNILNSHLFSSPSCDQFSFKLYKSRFSWANLEKCTELNTQTHSTMVHISFYMVH